MSCKTEIIPVTNKIRKYLKEMEINDKEKTKYSSIVLDGYNLRKERFKYIIFNDYSNKININDKILFYKNIANKLDYSLVWVYQELVLNGYGDYIDSNSDIYKASLLAYSDMKYFMEVDDIKGLECYEDYCLFNKDAFENNIKYKRLKK